MLLPELPFFFTRSAVSHAFLTQFQMQHLPKSLTLSTGDAFVLHSDYSYFKQKLRALLRFFFDSEGGAELWGHCQSTPDRICQKWSSKGDPLSKQREKFFEIRACLLRFLSPHSVNFFSLFFVFVFMCCCVGKWHFKDITVIRINFYILISKSQGRGSISKQTCFIGIPMPSDHLWASHNRCTQRNMWCCFRFKLDFKAPGIGTNLSRSSFFKW